MMTDGQTDGHTDGLDEDNTGFSRLCERALKMENYISLFGRMLLRNPKKRSVQASAYYTLFYFAP
jgi:hypothetical protein